MGLYEASLWITKKVEENDNSGKINIRKGLKMEWATDTFNQSNFKQ